MTVSTLIFWPEWRKPLSWVDNSVFPNLRAKTEEAPTSRVHVADWLPSLLRTYCTLYTRSHRSGGRAKPQ